MLACPATGAVARCSCFFFSSRRRHTRLQGDWSSDVCSSDLVDDGGINLAGVQRLLSIAEIVERIRPLMRDESLTARDTKRRLAHELDELSRDRESVG